MTRSMALRLATAACSAVALLSPAAIAQVESTPRHLVEVRIRDAASLDALLALDLDLAGCSSIELPAKTVDVVATDADLERLRRSDLAFDVAIRNLADHYEAELAKDAGTGRASLAGLNPPVGQGGMGGHYTLAEIESIIDSFVRNHPTLCSKQSIGKSIENRDIWMVKISDNVARDENEPEVYYDSIHHAREPVGASALLQFMDGLLSGYGSDPEATRIVNERELYCVPCVNPDGYEYNRRIRPSGGGLWRKNRRLISGSTYGVDLNRNYSTGWSRTGGASTNPRSDTYKGPSAFSEPETRAIRDFWATRRFSQVFSCHTYTDVLLRPWGYQQGNPPNAADYNRLGQLFTSRNGIRHGAASVILYVATGTTLDYGHTHGAFGWTPELGRRSEGGFWPSRTNQVNIVNRHQHMFRQVALNADNRTPADYETFGSGCAGSNRSTPALLGTAPKLGQSFSISVRNALAQSSAVLWFGVSNSMWNSTSLPFDLGSLGASGCSLLVSPEISLTRATDSSGRAVVSLPVPNDRQLHGAEFYNQWFVLDPQANNLGLVGSNGGAATIGL